MSESLAELMAAEEAAQAVETPEAPSTPEVPSDSSLETPPPESPPEAPSAPEVDPFIAEASEQTGLDLSKYKDKGAFLQAHVALQRKLSERDELSKLGESIIGSPYRDQVLAVLQGRLEELQKPAQPEPEKPASQEPEYDPVWDTIAQGENPPPDIVAKLNKRRTWERQRAETLIKAESLQQFASNPEEFMRKLIEPLLGPIKETQEQERQRLEEERLTAQVKTTLAPVEKQLFAGDSGDWNNVTPFGQKVLDRFRSAPELSADEAPHTTRLAWLKNCIAFEQASLPTPNQTRPVPPTAERAPNAGAPPLNPKAAEKALDEWYDKNPNAGVLEIQQMIDKLSGTA